VSDSRTAVRPEQWCAAVIIHADGTVCGHRGDPAGPARCPAARPVAWVRVAGRDIPLDAAAAAFGALTAALTDALTAVLASWAGPLTQLAAAIGAPGPRGESGDPTGDGPMDGQDPLPGI
jgi:hypothetical protein